MFAADIRPKCCGMYDVIDTYVRAHPVPRVSHPACRGAWTNFDAIMQIGVGGSLILIKIARGGFDDVATLSL